MSPPASRRPAIAASCPAPLDPAARPGLALPAAEQLLCGEEGEDPVRKTAERAGDALDAALRVGALVEVERGGVELVEAVAEQAEGQDRKQQRGAGGKLLFGRTVSLVDSALPLDSAIQPSTRYTMPRAA